MSAFPAHSSFLLVLPLPLSLLYALSFPEQPTPFPVPRPTPTLLSCRSPDLTLWEPLWVRGQQRATWAGHLGLGLSDFMSSIRGQVVAHLLGGVSTCLLPCVPANLWLQHSRGWGAEGPRPPKLPLHTVTCLWCGSSPESGVISCLLPFYSRGS